MSKTLSSLLIATVMLAGSLVFVPKVQAAELSLKDFIQLLIMIEVIPKDKVAAVNAYLASLSNGNDDSNNDSTKPIRQWSEAESRRAYDGLPNIVTDFDGKLRGPATQNEASKDCKNEGKRLPTWDEVVSKKANPSKFLTKYGDANQRIWTNLSCSTGHHSTAWRGIPDYVRDGLDVRAKDYYNNCTPDTYVQYYQCVSGDDDSEDQNEVDLTPSLKVTYPNGGENLKTGGSYKIKWNSENLNSLKIDIDLVRYEDSGRQASLTAIAHGVENTGSYSWKNITPTDDPNVPNLKILVSSADKGPSAQDYSDNYFTISCADPYIWNGHGTACVLGDDEDDDSGQDSDGTALSDNYTLIAFWNAIVGVPEGTYYDPRLLVSGSNGAVPADMVPAADSKSATAWCKLLGGKGFTSGTATGDEPVEVGKRVRFDGSKWIFGETDRSGEYSRVYSCTR